MNSRCARLSVFSFAAVAVGFALIIALSGSWRALEIIVGVLLAP